MSTKNHKLGLLTPSDIDLLREAFKQAIIETAPVTAAEITKVLQAELERAIGRGFMGWIRRFILTALLGLAGYAYIKSGGSIKSN